MSVRKRSCGLIHYFSFNFSLLLYVLHAFNASKTYSVLSTFISYYIYIYIYGAFNKFNDPRIYIYIYIYMSSSSSSCRATSTENPDPLSPLLPIIHRFWQVFRATHPVTSYSCCMYVRAGRLAFDWRYAGVHRSTSLMSSPLFLQLCPACLDCLTCIVFVMGGRWP